VSVVMSAVSAGLNAEMYEALTGRVMPGRPASRRLPAPHRRAGRARMAGDHCLGVPTRASSGSRTDGAASDTGAGPGRSAPDFGATDQAGPQADHGLISPHVADARPPGRRAWPTRTSSCFGGSIRLSTVATSRACSRLRTVHRSSSFVPLGGSSYLTLRGCRGGTRDLGRSWKGSGANSTTPILAPRVHRRGRSSTHLGHLPGPWEAERRGDERGRLGRMDRAGRQGCSLAGIRGPGGDPRSRGLGE
jgi:hypothetical protein